MKRVYKCIVCGVRRCSKLKEVCGVCQLKCDHDPCICNELATLGVN